ncbi:hypothetical protein J6590_007597, partial [Homalodisca vitripennis]
MTDPKERDDRYNPSATRHVESVISCSLRFTTYSELTQLTTNLSQPTYFTCT